MSIKVMSQIWENSKQSGAGLLLLLALADFADDNGVCYPGISRLAEKTRRTESAVQKALKQLVADGDLKIRHNEGISTPSGKTNLYQIVIPQVKMDSQGVEKLPPLKNEGVEKLPPPKSNGVEKLPPHGVEKLPPDPSEESSVFKKLQPQPACEEKIPKDIEEPPPGGAVGQQNSSDDLLAEFESLFTAHFGELSGNPKDPLTVDVKAALKEYGLGTVVQAINTALVDRAGGKRKTWGYVKAILRGEKDASQNQPAYVAAGNRGRKPEVAGPARVRDRPPVKRFAADLPGGSGISLGD